MFFEDEDVPYEDGAFHEDDSVYMEKRMEDNDDTQINEGTDMLQRKTIIMKGYIEIWWKMQA